MEATVDDFEGLSIHSLNMVLNVMRVAAPTLADQDDPARVAVLKKIENLQKQEHEKTSGNESEER